MYQDDLLSDQENFRGKVTRPKTYIKYWRETVAVNDHFKKRGVLSLLNITGPKGDS